VYLVTDPQRLEQVLKNLLSNAMKFTEKGQVTLQVSRRDNGRVAFAVVEFCKMEIRPTLGRKNLVSRFFLPKP